MNQPRPPDSLFLVLSLLGCVLALMGCPKGSVSEPPPAVRQPDLTLEAQRRLVDEARAHARHERPHAAIRVLSTLMERHPTSPFQAEMRWLLARAYEQTGNLEAAAKHYRTIVQASLEGGSDDQRLTQLASQRLGALTPKLPAIGPRHVNALLLTPTRIPSGPDRGRWLAALADSGITALVLEASTRPGTPSASDEQESSTAAGDFTPQAGVYFRTSWAPVIDDLFEQVIPLAHEYGISVFGAITLRQMTWLEPPAGWADSVYDPESKTVAVSHALDVFHPGFQQYVSGLLRDLADSGIDGLLFRGDAPLGPFDGLSSFALDEFRRTFGLAVNPDTLFNDPAGTVASTEGGLMPSQAFRTAPSEFWRWTGWKSRARLDIITAMGKEIRQRFPDFTVGLEMHAEAVSNPVAALVRYSEDLVEANRAGLDFIVAWVDHPTRGKLSAPSSSRRNSESNALPSDTNPLARLLEIMGRPERVWLARSLDPPSDPVSKHVYPHADRASLPDQIGILYVTSSPLLP